ncbi:MAG: PAS domain-containing protein [Opitutaceae bacterium]|nr:PAS domain-containing protein [Opitutaceae bacterium]
MTAESTLNRFALSAAILTVLSAVANLALPHMPTATALCFGLAAIVICLPRELRGEPVIRWAAGLGIAFAGVASLAAAGPVSGSAALPWWRVDSPVEAMLLLLTGTGLLCLHLPRREWWNAPFWLGAAISALAVPALMLGFAGRTEAPGLTPGSAATALIFGLALAATRVGRGLLRMLQRGSLSNPDSRWLLAVVLLPSGSLLLLLLQWPEALPGTGPGYFLPVITTSFSVLGLLGLVAFCLRQLDAMALAKSASEEERDRLLERLQGESAKLQQEVARRTQELANALELSKRFDYLARTTTNGVFITDAEGRIEWVNAAWEFFTGYSLTEVRGRRPDTFLHGHDTDPFTATQIQSALEAVRPIKVEILNYRKDGSPLWVILEIQPIRNEAGVLTNFVAIQGDITAQKRRDEEQRQLNERLTLALSALDCGVWDFDAVNGRLESSRRQCEIYGVDPAAFDGRPGFFEAFVHPDDLARVRAATSQTAAQGTMLEYDFRIIRPDGKLRHIKSHGSLWCNAAGRVVRIVGLDRDVTAAVELREQLGLAEERWQLALAGTNDGVWDADLVTGRTFYDQRWAEMIGCTPEELSTEADAWATRVHPEDLPNARTALQAHLEGQTPFYVCEHRLRHADGHWVWVLDRGRVVARDAGGRALRITGTHVDISARKALEEQLRHSEVMSLQLSRLANIGAWELNLATNRLTWAPEIYRIHEVELGYIPTQEQAMEFFPPPARRRLEDAIRRAVQESTPFDLELPFTTARGNKLWVRVQGRGDGRPGEGARVYGAFQDITARRDAEDMRRQLEAQLFQAQKMETLGTMAGGIAHDFNNLLTGIIGYHDLALDTLAPDDPSRSCLASAREASMRARELVDQILTFSRQAGSEMVPVNLGQVIEDARRFLRATIPATVHLEVVIAPDCESAMADSTQIHQVLLNLCSNAVHAMPPSGGAIRLELDQVTQEYDANNPLDQLPPGRYLRLVFSDNGHGMDEETCKRIFDPFFTTKEVGQGTGLGLSVVHGIIQAHRGTIAVSSQTGVGTTFTILIPAADGLSGDPDLVESNVPRGNGELIALVDDEEIIRSFAQMALERFGYRVKVFDNPAACLEELRQNSQEYDALLTDQTMPGMPGIELAAAVRQLAPGMLIIIMSGYFSRISADNLAKLGRVELLSKPFTKEELAQAVHRAFQTEMGALPGPGPAG